MSSRYILRKLFNALLTILAIVVLNFVLFRLMPGLARAPDAATRTSDPRSSPRTARGGASTSRFPEQLVLYLKSTVTGDLGYSIKYRGQPVTEVVLNATGPTVLLIGLGEAIAIVVGLWLGARSGWRGEARSTGWATR